MIKHLQIRLTVLFSFLTGLILFLAVAFTLRLNLRDYKKSFILHFDSQLESLESHFRSVSIIKDSFLREQEINYNAIIYILDNDSPLYFQGSTVLKDRRDDLISYVSDWTASFYPEGPQLCSSEGPFSFLFSLSNGDKTKYWCNHKQFSLEDGQEITLYMIRDLAEYRRHIRHTVLIYGLLTLGGILILTLLNYLMVCLSLRPAKETLKQQKEFIAAASHELRSPLTVIRTNLELLKDNTDRNSSNHLLDISLKETERMKHLTDDLLNLTNLDAKEKVIPLSDVNIDSLLMETFDSFYEICKKNNHLLTISLPSKELPHIETNEEALKELLGIFIQNAITHTAEGTEIEIKGKEDGSALFLSIIDHGEGIPDALKNKVFQRFYQKDQSRTDKSHYGLGLSIARELSEALHCKLKLTDTAGGGATFTLKFGSDMILSRQRKVNN